MADIFVAPKKDKKQVADKSPLYESNRMGFLSSFSRNPKDISFQTQRKEEIVILFLRSHLITNLGWALLGILFLILPIIINMILPSMNFEAFSSPDAPRFILVYTLFYYLIVFSYMFINFLHWFYNIFIITTERVIDLDYSDIVIHNMAETKFSHVEDIRYSQSGFIPSFLNYGDIFIQTAGTEENFEAFSIPQPRKAAEIAIDLMERR